MNDAETRETILRWITRPQYQPVKAVTLAQQIGLLKEDFKEFQKLIRNMHKQNLLRMGTGHIVFPLPDAMAQAGAIVGYFKRMPEGYGFVSETELVPNQENISDRPDDIYIPPGKAQDAASGDFVSVTLDRNSADGRGRGPRGRGRSGSIDRILERAKQTFVGTFTEDRGEGWVEVDGRIFSDPIRIGDSGVNHVKTGDKVVIDMIRFPSSWRCGEAVIIEVLGPRGDIRTETLSVMRQYELPEKFPDAALAEARKQADLFAKWEESHAQLTESVLDDGRRNLTDWFTITIDPADARDFDDAISIRMEENGNVCLGVHIADVSNFVQPDTQLDHEAYERGNSVYLPDRVIPMLPEVLCNGLASLQPHRNRLAKTVFQTFTPNGLCTDVEICDSVICSDARLNYEQVDRFFAGDETELDADVRGVLRKFRDLARNLRQRRTARGKLDMSIPEIRLVLDADGNVVGVQQEVNTESHQMIEEFMVSTNEAVAQALVDAGSNLMRRVHKPPTVAKIDALADFLEELGIHISNAADRMELQRVLRKTAGKPDEFAVHQAILRAMQRAVYSPEIEGHYALASECYCHFTSPIRRYADLTIHRQIENYLLGKSAKRNFRRIYDEGQHLSHCERNAEEAERELTRVKMIHFFQDKGEMELDARIVGLTHYGFFVACVEYPLSGLVSLDGLPRDRYHFDVRSQTLNGRREGNLFRLGDKVRVKIDRLDPNQREITFVLAGVERGPMLTGVQDLDDADEYEDLDVHKFPKFDDETGSDDSTLSYGNVISQRAKAAKRRKEAKKNRTSSKKARKARRKK